jgi:hypothetical protein
MEYRFWLILGMIYYHKPSAPQKYTNLWLIHDLRLKTLDLNVILLSNNVP